MRKLLRHIPRILVLPFFLTALFLTNNQANSQQSPETWGDFINEPEISYGDLRSAQEHLNDERIVMSAFSSFECQEVAYPIILGHDFNSCWYDSEGHKTTKGGQGYVPAGETKAGFMHNFETLLFPTKYDVLIEQTTSYDKAWLRKGDSLSATLVEDPVGQNPNFWVWDNPASLELRNESGSPFYFHGNYLYAQTTFSSNGRWMLFFDESGYLVRIDLETLQITTYRVTDGSETFWPAIAISDSGRYIAVNDRVDEFYIMDTRVCSTPTDRIIVPVNISECAKRSIREYADEHFENLYQAWLEFYNDDVARIKGLSRDGSNGEEIIIRAPNTKRGTNYIALGDSYTSGEGAYSYLPGTDEPNNRCHISSKSYPFLLGSWLRLDSVHSVACSGAKIHNISGGHPNNAVQNTKPTQNQSLGKWIPGYKWQIEHVKDVSSPVDIITVGISGNDIGFSDKLTECLKPSNCFMSAYDRVGIALEINHQYDGLVSMYSSLRSQALKKSPTARVYAIGYPQVFDVNGSYRGLCGNNVRLTYAEVLMASNLINYLNQIIQKAAERAGISYISISGALGDHTLCGSSPSKAVNGLTIGDGAVRYYLGPVAIESFHPSYYGHSLIADVIRERSSGFRDPLPRPNLNISAPDVLSSQLVLSSTDMTEDVRRFVYGRDISSEIVYIQGNQYIFVGNDYSLKIGSRVKLMMRSNPTYLGEFEVNHQGEVFIEYTVPESIEPGIHTLHILGETVEGENIDIYKTVLVAVSENDWDGDGIPNDQEPCGIFKPADADEDGDGIDDGCDGLIESLNEQGSKDGRFTGVVIGSQNNNYSFQESSVSKLLNLDATNKSADISDVMGVESISQTKSSGPPGIVILACLSTLSGGILGKQLKQRRATGRTM